MSIGLRRLAAATAGALAVALTLGTASPALAQTASIDPSTLIDPSELGQEDFEAIIDAIGSGMADVPQTMGEASAQYAEQMNQLIEYMKETQQMLNSALDRMGGGAQ